MVMKKVKYRNQSDFLENLKNGVLKQIHLIKKLQVLKI